MAQLSPDALKEKVVPLSVTDQKTVAINVGKLSDPDFEVLKNSSVDEQKKRLDIKSQPPRPTPHRSITRRQHATASPTARSNSIKPS